MEIEDSSPLTSYKPGSIWELWQISLPLMISNLASLLMIFIDRMFLANYSVEALNSAVSAGTLAWAFLGGFGMLSSMSEIFVSQFNGAKQFAKIGSSVWQMIWISIFSTVFFLPLAFYGADFFFVAGYLPSQREYFTYLLLFGPFYTLMTALSGFYIGRGRSRILIYLAVLGNILNICLDALFIFGYGSIIPEMGIRGAAIATSIGYIVQAVILLALFLSKKNQKAFSTNAWKIDPILFKKSFQIGLPQGVFYMLEMIGFAVFYELMKMVSLEHLTISGICQTFLILFSFFIEGLSKGVCAVSGNFIGSKNTRLIDQVLKAGVLLQVGFSLFMALGFFAPKESISYFFPEAARFLQEIGGQNSTDALWFCLFCSFLYISFEGFRWVVAGILTSAGDTLFLLIAGGLSVWVLLIFPIYFLVLNQSLSISVAWSISALYSFLSCGIYLQRYRQGSWKKIDLIENTTEHQEKTPL